MLKTVIALKLDGVSIKAISILFDIPHKDFDLISAVKAALVDYSKTEDGEDLLYYKCAVINWADFAEYVPNYICQQHGFSKIEGELSGMIIDWDENLVTKNSGGNEHEL